MRISNRHGGMAAGAVALALAALLVGPAVGLAGGTGDGKYLPDRLPMRERVKKAALECEEPVSASIIDAPYAVLWTPSHKQERSYWCGPATVQVIDDYFGTAASQSAIATYLGTTTSGTVFSKVDDALRNYTGKSYYYYGSLSESGFYAKVAHSLDVHGQPLAADLRIDASVWPTYTHDHAGHIVPVEAFDWRYNTIRLNDVYDEASAYSDGGDTYGHRTYNRAVVWNGVSLHPQRAVVSAP